MPAHRAIENADQSIPQRLATKMPGLIQLLDAYLLAEQLGKDRWQFAVEMGRLEAAGLDCNDLRLSLALELTSHAAEVTNPRSAVRRFTLLKATSLPATACFVLTDLGARALSRRVSVASNELRELGLKPHWNAKTRELSLGGKVVKRFAVPAENQVRILAAFEEEDWAECVEDPLPPREEVDSKRRLRDTVKRLNRCRASAGLRFSTDGLGQGIRWSRRPCDVTVSVESTPDRH